MTENEMEESDNKSSFKKLQTYVPDFRGYSRKEDLRDADRAIRMILSQKLSLARKNLEESVRKLEDAMRFEEADAIAVPLNHLKRIESEIAYADSGLTWLASDITVPEEELERLYELDADLLDKSTLLLKKTEELKQATSANNVPNLKTEFAEIRTRLSALEETFRKRMIAMSNVR